jgi:hypothetical protein
MDALELLDNLTKMDIEDLAGAALKDNAEVIADLNALQMNQGFRADGTEILPSYTPLTVFLKKEKGQVTDHVTLRDTGDFQSELYAEVEGQTIEYGSRDSKSEKLEDKYSTAKGSIFGLTEDSRDELINQHLEEDFLNKVREGTGL